MAKVMGGDETEMIMQKLSSRKLWAAIVAVAVAAVVIIFGESIPAEVLDLMKNALGVVSAYIFGESGVDIARLICNKNSSGTENK